MLFRELNDYLFQRKSLDEIVKDYDINIKTGIYTDKEKIKNGKMLYNDLKEELHQIRKTEDDLTLIIVDYLFDSNNLEIEELSAFFELKLK